MNDAYTEEPDELELSVLEAKKLNQNCKALIADNRTLEAENVRQREALEFIKEESSSVRSKELRTIYRATITALKEDTP